MKNKVILFSIDGMRPDGVIKCKNPYVDELKKMTSFTSDAILTDRVPTIADIMGFPRQKNGRENRL